MKYDSQKMSLNMDGSGEDLLTMIVMCMDRDKDLEMILKNAIKLFNRAQVEIIIEEATKH